MGHTFDTMGVKNLKHYYELYLSKLAVLTPDNENFATITLKVEEVEKILRKKCPDYFEPTNRDIIENIKDNNYNVHEASEMLNITRQTLYNWIKKKWIKIIRVGRKPYVPKEEVERIFKNGTG